MVRQGPFQLRRLGVGPPGLGVCLWCWGGALTSLGTEKQDQCTWLPPRVAGGSGEPRATGPGFAPGSPSSCCPGSRWRGHWTSAGGSGLGTALSSHPLAQCTWLQESRGGSVTSSPDAHTPGSHSHPDQTQLLLLQYLLTSVTEGSTVQDPGSNRAQPPNIFSSPFLFVKPSKHIFLVNKFICFSFCSLENLLGKLSYSFSTQQLKCCNLGTNSVAYKKCFFLGKEKMENGNRKR